MGRSLSAIGVVLAVAGATSATAPVDLQGSVKAEGRPRIRFLTYLCAQVGVVHQPVRSLPGAGTALDLGLTYSLRGQ